MEVTKTISGMEFDVIYADGVSGVIRSTLLDAAEHVRQMEVPK